MKVEIENNMHKWILKHIMWCGKLLHYLKKIYELLFDMKKLDEAFKLIYS